MNSIFFISLRMNIFTWLKEEFATKLMNYSIDYDILYLFYIFVSRFKSITLFEYTKMCLIFEIKVGISSKRTSY